MNMSPRDGIYYAGLMAGLAAGSLLGQFLFGWHRLLAAVVFGLPLGLLLSWLGQRFYDRNFRPSPPQDRAQGPETNPYPPSSDSPDDTRDIGLITNCPSRRCDWSGDKAERYCPRCGQDLS